MTRTTYTLAAAVILAATGGTLHALMGPTAWALIAGPALLAYVDLGAALGLWKQGGTGDHECWRDCPQEVAPHDHH